MLLLWLYLQDVPPDLYDMAARFQRMKDDGRDGRRGGGGGSRFGGGMRSGFGGGGGGFGGGGRSGFGGGRRGGRSRDSDGDGMCGFMLG